MYSIQFVLHVCNRFQNGANIHACVSSCKSVYKCVSVVCVECLFATCVSDCLYLKFVSVLVFTFVSV